MDLDEIKEIIEADGGKFIIVENGKPVAVFTSFEDYKNKLRLKKLDNSEKINLQKKNQKLIPKELEEEELKIEDLPF